MSRGYYGVGAEFPGELGAEFPGELGEAVAQAAPGSPLTKRDPRIEDLMLGGGTDGTTEPWLIPAGQTRQFEINPRLVFRCDRLVLTPSDADDAEDASSLLLLDSVNVNARDQVVTRDPVPLGVWGQNATHHLGGDVMRPGVGAVFRVTNANTSDLSLRASLFGEAVRSEMGIPQDVAVEMLRSSPRVDLGRVVQRPYEDLVGASPLIELTSPDETTIGPAVTVQLNPKLRFRTSRMVICPADGEGGTGYWNPSGSFGVQPGIATVESVQIATQEQIVGGILDAAAFGSSSTHRLKGSIMDPGNGAYITLRPSFLGTSEFPVTRQVRVVVYGRADTDV